MFIVLELKKVYAFIPSQQQVVDLKGILLVKV